MLGGRPLAPLPLLGPAARSADYSPFPRYPARPLGLLHVFKVNGRDYNEPTGGAGPNALDNGQVVPGSARTRLAHDTSRPPGDPTHPLAASAGGRTPEAWLACPVNATILDAATVGGAFLAGVGDGSGRLVARNDPLLFAQATAVVPGARPDPPRALASLGGDVWRLWPRDVAEYRNL